MEGDLEPVVRLLAENRWPWRLHATYNETITRALDVFEKVNRDVPFDGLHWFFDHAETIDDRNIDRIAALGGGIAVQHRMAYQGEYFVERYGAKAAERTPPIRRMLEAGVPVGAGTDATRVASYNPWVSLSWLVTGKTLGGLTLYPSANRLDRETALRLWTEANTWFSNEEGKKGQIKARPARRPRGAVGRLLLRARGRDPGHHVGADGARRQARARRRRLRRISRRRCRPPMPDWSPVRDLRRLPAARRQRRGSASTPSRRPTAAAPVPAASTATPMPRAWARQRADLGRALVLGRARLLLLGVLTGRLP